MTGLKPNAPAAKEEVSANFFKPKYNLEMDSFSIQVMERDPFLGSITNTRKQKKSSPKKTTNPKKKNDKSSISYLGLIQKQKTGKEIFIIKIKNEQYLLKLGESVLGIKLLKGSPQKIVVKNQDKKQTIPIS